VRHKDAPIARESPTPEVTLPGNDTATDENKDESKPTQEEKEDDTTPSPATTETEALPETEVATLSQTGPADTAVQLIAVGALAVAGISFVRSRNHTASL
jgi:uncharacterized protein HemX